MKSRHVLAELVNMTFHDYAGLTLYNRTIGSGSLDRGFVLRESRHGSHKQNNPKRGFHFSPLFHKRIRNSRRYTLLSGCSTCRLNILVRTQSTAVMRAQWGIHVGVWEKRAAGPQLWSAYLNLRVSHTLRPLQCVRGSAVVKIHETEFNGLQSKPAPFKIRRARHPENPSQSRSHPPFIRHRMPGEFARSCF